LTLTSKQTADCASSLWLSQGYPTFLNEVYSFGI
jgi:hypothetical protein